MKKTKKIEMVYQTFGWLFSCHQYAKRLLLYFQSLHARFELTEQTQNKNVRRFHVLKIDLLSNDRLN